MAFTHILLLLGLLCWFLSLLTCCWCQLSEYKRTNLCFLSERLIYGYSSIELVKGGNRFQCANMCNFEKNCIGFSFEEKPYSVIKDPGRTGNYTCYLHEEFMTNKECYGHLVESHHKFYRKYRTCANEGVWNEGTQTCKCEGESSKPDIFVGPMCTTRPRNCRDLSKYVIKPFSDSVYLKPWPYLEQDNEVLVHCTISEHGVTKIRVALNRKTEGVFNKTWTQYQKEFGDQDHYWIGLELLYSILLSTADPSTIYMEVLSKGSDPFFGFVKFYDVKLTDASDRYRLSYSGFSLHEKFSQFGDNYCWKYSNNTQFSTHDLDNDMNAMENCAALNGVGWWFGTNCSSPCNLMGSRYFWGMVNKVVKPEYSLGQIRVPGFSSKDMARKFEHAIIEIHA